MILPTLRQQADEELRTRLLNGFLSLVSDEEVLKLMENLLSYEEYDYETPYLRRWREKGLTEGRAEGRAQGRSEGRAEGRAQGLTEGRAEGRSEGRAEGQLSGLRQAILAIIASRFDPPFSKVLVLEKYIETISDEARLQALIVDLSLASSFDAVLAELPNGTQRNGS
ncbi:MAG TPA: hypothetical protein PKM78_03580 [Anaerolineae bacterium]|nr:hypothetical protein [Anaerolineae bacterium]HNU02969.1 hypothetical protein [Anaerolineae bacterium]